MEIIVKLDGKKIKIPLLLKKTNMPLPKEYRHFCSGCSTPFITGEVEYAMSLILEEPLEDKTVYYLLHLCTKCVEWVNIGYSLCKCVTCGCSHWSEPTEDNKRPSYGFFNSCKICFASKFFYHWRVLYDLDNCLETKTDHSVNQLAHQ